MHASARENILRDAGVAHQVEEAKLGTVIRIAPSDVRAAVGALAAGGFEQLVDLFATDTGEAIEVTYHVRDLPDYVSFFLKTTIAYDGELASVWEVYPAALYPEREAAELLGMSLSGHPNPKRLLTVEGTEPLLRKSVAIRGAEEVQFS
jgi:NADH:ubiquinone oxidoreductase subunit C